jgi:hypothetical protein
MNPIIKDPLFCRPARQKSRLLRAKFAAIVGAFLIGLMTPSAGAQAPPDASQPATTAPAVTAALPAGALENAPVHLAALTVNGELDAAREEIAPSLGAVTYSIDANQIQTMGQGENSSFQQVLLQEPGVVQDEFGEIHVRGDHGDVGYRINGVLLPESLNGFAQEIDTHLIQSVTLLTGTMPAQFGERTAGIIDVTTKIMPMR